jgi:putative glycosyltransferase (TIGR04348 family)
MPSLARPVVYLVTPGTRDANNGNWRTAARWARMLRDRYRVIVQTAWDRTRADAMIALHARRSAESIAAYRAESRGPLAVVLTGTDLYRDLPKGGETARSLDFADRLVVLQDDALRHLKPEWARKCDVVFQSAPALRHRAGANGTLDCVAVGHLRDEKDPLTLLAAVAKVPKTVALRVAHIGAPLDERLGKAARDLARRDPRYRYLGALPHGLTRIALARSDVLIHPSIMEGGANVIVEAITAGTPVIASRMSGNIGMLGANHPGYFEPGDAEGLAALLRRAAEEPAYLRALAKACNSRKALFHPSAEARAVRKLAAHLLSQAKR